MSESSSTEQSEQFVLTLPDDPASAKDWYLWAGVLAILVFVAFLPAVRGSYIWDDDHHAKLFDDVPGLQSLSGLARIWTTHTATPQYYPFTFTTFWLEHLLWKDNTLGYHLGNLITHALSAIIVWRLLKRLALPAAWLAAAIWAIHPLQAESVCWISERKNVLSGLMFFSSIWFYLEYAGLTPPPKQAGRPGMSADGTTWLLGNPKLAYGLSLLLLVLGLLAKTVVSAMPAVMLIILWWKGRKLRDKRTIVPLIPFFAVGLALSLITVYIETQPGGNVQANGADWALSPIQRVLIASRGVWFYTAKLVWPMKLTFSYPRVLPSIAALGAAVYAVQWGYFLAAVGVIGLLAAGVKIFGRGALAAVLFFGVTLFPALGFINVFPMRYSFVADHFQYLSGLGLIVLFVAIAAGAARHLGIKPALAATGATVLLLSLGAQTWLQAGIYESPLTLWRDTLAKNPDSWMAADNYGAALLRDAAEKQRLVATDQAQGLTDAVTDDTKAMNDDYTEAEHWFKRALDLRPEHDVSYDGLGQVYSMTNRWPDAEEAFKKAVDLNEQEELNHQTIAPYLNYAKAVEHNHPDSDVRQWLDKALNLADQPRVRSIPTNLAAVHLAYGNYWWNRLGRDLQAKKDINVQVTDLASTIDELNQGLTYFPKDLANRFTLAQAYHSMAVLDQDRADQARAAGNLTEAADLEARSHEVDDQQAAAIYIYITENTQPTPQAGALAREKLGEIYAGFIIQDNTQSDAMGDMIKSMMLFNQASQLDPTRAEPPKYLAALSQQFLSEGLKTRRHGASWAPLKEKLDALIAGPVTKAVADDALDAAREARWPLVNTHPLQQPLQTLQAAVRAYEADKPAADADKSLQAAAANALKAFDKRDAAADAVSDDMGAAICFEGALTSDPQSTQAWNNLKATADDLDRLLAAPSSVPGSHEALNRAWSVLSQHGAATQPATQPAATKPS